MAAFKTKRDKGYMLKINEDEAMSIIKSLVSQIIAKDCNSGRKEFYTDKQEYFSISVVCEHENYFKKCLAQKQEIIEDQDNAMQQLYKKLGDEQMEERKPLGDAQKPKCPKCHKVLREVGDKLKCTKKCGFECSKNADKCCCCGVILDEDH